MNQSILRIIVVTAVVVLSSNPVLADGGGPISVPEVGSTILLLIVSLGGIETARRILCRDRK
jgi:hypothetical protein